MSKRFLTKTEIDDILKDIPIVNSSVKDIGIYAREQIVKNLRRTLERKEIYPEIIPQIKNNIIRQYQKSQIDAGSSVGFLAAESLSAPITQIALNSFHSSGASRYIASGIDTIREILSVNKKRSQYTMNLYFKNELTYDDILNMRSRYVEVTIGNCISNYDLIDPQDLEQTWWRDFYLKITRQSIPKTSLMMRLELKVSELVKYKIDMDEIVKGIEGYKPPNLVIIPSPISIGIIEIYVDEQDFLSQSIEGSNLILFYNSVLYPVIVNLTLRGIKGIKSLFPIATPTISILNDEFQLPNKTWQLSFDALRIKSSGITIENFVRLAELCGLIINTQDTDNLTINVTVPSNLNKSPRSIIISLVASDLVDEDQQERDQRKLGKRGWRRPETDISLASKKWWAEVDGHNLRTVLTDPYIDPSLVFSNDIYELTQVLGIEGARTFIIEEITNVLDREGSYINPRHLYLISDFMTHLGIPTPITYTGLSKQNVDALALASYERAMETISKSATFGSETPATSVSTSIMMGKRIKSGTGSVDIIPNPKKYLPPPISVNDLSSAIDNFIPNISSTSSSSNSVSTTSSTSRNTTSRTTSQLPKPNDPPQSTIKLNSHPKITSPPTNPRSVVSPYLRNLANQTVPTVPSTQNITTIINKPSNNNNNNNNNNTEINNSTRIVELSVPKQDLSDFI